MIESVPNVSEGRRHHVVDRLAAAIEAVPGVHLLDRTSDASHNRSVFTLAGEHGPVADALDALVGTAIQEIEMDTHAGEHPRIGAVDVIPFIPLAATTMTDCIELARAFGERIAARYSLPVYLYANAATRAERVKLADVRRGQYEGAARRDLATRSRARLWSGAAAPVGGRRRGWRSTIPDRLQHQPSVRGRRPGQADRAAGP